MTKSSAEVEREVEAARGQIDQTVEALKDKMQPKELFDEATKIMGQTSNKVLTTVVEQARENPIPIALIGAGVAWLALSMARSGRGSDGSFSGQYYETYEGYDEDAGKGRKLKAKARNVAQAAKGRIADAKEKASGAVAHAREGLADARAQAADGAGQVRGRMQDFAATAQQRAGEYGRQAQAKFQETLDGEPLILAALGLAVGVAIGASLPATRTERRYIGPTRDKVMDRGRSFAQESYDQAKDVAQRAYGQVKDELHRQTGPEGEGSSLSEKASALADAGTQVVRDEVEGRLAH
jgi:hypothetical protein